MDSTTYAYLAGFFDGEGSISIERAGMNSQSLRINAVNTDPRPIEMLQRVFAGNFRSTLFRGRTKDGREYRPTYHWRVSSTLAKDALEAMLPYLTVKRERAEIAIAFERLRQQHHSLYEYQRHPDEAWQAREDLRGLMLTLNNRVCGVPHRPRPVPVGKINRSLRAGRMGNIIQIQKQEVG